MSHDRRFIDRLSRTIWEVRDGRFTRYDGDWAHYQRKRAEQSRRASVAKSTRSARVQPRPRGPSRWQLAREQELLEARIGELEQRLVELTGTLAVPDRLDPQQISALGREHAEVEASLLDAMARWEQTAALLGDGDG